MSVDKQRLNFHWKDIFLLLAIAAVTTAVVIALMLRSERNIAHANIRMASRRAAVEFEKVVGDVESELRAARQYGVDPSKMADAQHYFENSVFVKMDKLAGISLAEKDGKAFYLLRDGTLTDIRAEGGYEPESRIWFSGPLGAEDPDSCFWTGIYPFRTIGKPGISASLSWEGPRGQPVVAAYDILLDDFFSAVQGLAPTPESEAFVFLADGTLYVPGNEELSLSRSIASDKEDLARQGLGVWKKQFLGDTGSDVRVAATRFGGRAWWCGFVPLARANRSVWMCVMVPNSDLMADVIDQRLIFAGTGLILIIAFSSVYLIFARRSPEPQFANTVSADQIRALIDKGENQAIEFKSTMRMNLHSKKPGREIEVAWLKGVAAFLNTNGGTLLLGVTDAGDVTGLEQDVFENDDKCRLHFKNLIAKALGADLSKFIRFRLVPLDDKTIGVVECIKASRPVYLRDGNKETFYIRNGPSSDELPASRMVDYIAEHWK